MYDICFDYTDFQSEELFNISQNACQVNTLSYG